MAQNFTLTADENGIATLLWDRPAQSMNTMTFEALAEFETLLRQAFAQSDIKGVILTSGKDSFSGGMDLRALLTIFETASPEEVQTRMQALHRLFRQIETGFDGVTKPVVCALNGTAMGLGIELALACHWSIAAQREGSKLGLPEMKLGLFPGGGGTTRMIRRRGLLAAAPILLEGRSYSPEAALEVGLIDALAPPETLLAEAKDWILKATPEKLVKPWDRPGFRLPGGHAYSPAGMQSFIAANAFVAARTSPRLPAPQALLQAAYEGSLLGIDGALEIEAAHFAALLARPETQAMIRSLFVGKQALDKGARRPDLPKTQIKRIGVVGAGMMGAAIASLAAQRGFEVICVEPSDAARAKGEARARALIEKAVAKGILSPEGGAKAQAALTFASALNALHAAELVIEAASEALPVKQSIFEALGAILPKEALIASNTSSLSIAALARFVPHPDRILGLHFFSPVERMALVEIVSHPETAPEAQAAAFDVARQLGKTPIFVRDAPGFYANRLIIPFLYEALRLLSEGVAPAYIENLARQLGFPVGPLQVMDEVSLTLADAIDESFGRPDPTITTALRALLDAKRSGRASGAGFYNYAEGERQGLWEGLQDLFPPSAVQPPRAEVEARLMQVQVLEALRALEDGTIDDLREADVGAILGWGFAPWSGGPFGWLDQKGLPEALAEAEDLAARFGPRFAPPALLRTRAAQKRSFY